MSQYTEKELSEGKEVRDMVLLVTGNSGAIVGLGTYIHYCKAQDLTLDASARLTDLVRTGDITRTDLEQIIGPLFTTRYIHHGQPCNPGYYEELVPGAGKIAEPLRQIAMRSETPQKLLRAEVLQTSVNLNALTEYHMREAYIEGPILALSFFIIPLVYIVREFRQPIKRGVEIIEKIYRTI